MLSLNLDEILLKRRAGAPSPAWMIILVGPLAASILYGPLLYAFGVLGESVGEVPRALQFIKYLLPFGGETMGSARVLSESGEIAIINHIRFVSATLCIVTTVCAGIYLVRRLAYFPIAVKSSALACVLAVGFSVLAATCMFVAMAAPGSGEEFAFVERHRDVGEYITRLSAGLAGFAVCCMAAIQCFYYTFMRTPSQ